MSDDGTRSELPSLVLVSPYPPSSAVGGGGIILSALLQDYPQEKLTVVSLARWRDCLATQPDGGALLPARYEWWQPWEASMRGVARAAALSNWLRVLPLARRIARLAAGGVILAVPHTSYYCSELYIAACWAHRISGAPLLLYELDEWKPVETPVASFIEPLMHKRMMRAAAGVYAISEFAAADFTQRFGVPVESLPNIVDTKSYPAYAPTPRASGECTLLYAGSILGEHAQALAFVADVLNSHPCNTRLVLYTNISADAAAKLGIAGQRVSLKPFVQPGTLPQALAAADALLLPFAFLEELRWVFAKAMPTKVADYLASGVPTLVHAPAYSSIAQLARREGWGLVVDQQSPDAMAHAIQQIMTDAELRSTLHQKALQVAHARHDATQRRAEFHAKLASLKTSLKG
jgi:glycosyltransferase involved in cell wall biosynthesis